ncbi:hypothetical protein RJ55_04055 [Drechmeria coniospora]|nr:hypothetical protein RJ55_04055 [Drechmeria coniospora]
MLLSEQPYTFRGLVAIGTAFYLLNLVLFCTFFALVVARFVRKPRAFITSLHHPSESFFFGSVWVSIALIIYGMQVYGVPRTGPWLVHVLAILFWTYLTSATLVAIFQYHVIFHDERLTLTDAMPSWILPAYPLLMTGVLSAAIARSQTQHVGIHLIVAGIAGQGLGWILAFFIYTVYLTRLIHGSMPPASVRPGMYVSVGPAAYTCAGFLALGKMAKKHLPPDFLGVQESFAVGDVWFAISVPTALFLWLIAIWFSALSTLSIIRAARKMKFSLQWWAFVFPNAGLAIATIHVGNALESKGIKVAGSILTVLLVPLWILCACLHVRSIWTHQLLAPGKDVGVDDVNDTHDAKLERYRARKRDRVERQQAQGARKQIGRGALWARKWMSSPAPVEHGIAASENSMETTQGHV